MDIRTKIANLATTYIGLGSKVEKDKYLDLLSTDKDSTAMKLDMLNMSSCALAVRGLWRKCGCDHPILTNPYRIGRAMSDILSISKDYKAWNLPGIYSPQVGDAVIVGDPGKEHAFTIVEIIGDNEFVTVDGGQGPKGANIDKISRKWSKEGNKWIDFNSHNSKRPILGIADISKFNFKS